MTVLTRAPLVAVMLLSARHNTEGVIERSDPWLLYSAPNIFVLWSLWRIDGAQ